jgi:lysophospholipase
MEKAASPRREHPAGAVFGAWSAPDGWALRRMDWPHEGRGKARGSLILANGRGDFIEKYLEACAHWHDRGWNVTSFDWRGQGGSRGAGYDCRSFDGLVDDLAALLSDWRSGNPGPHVAIGHSMGGHLLLRALVEGKPELDAAILVAPMIGVNSAPTPAWLAPTIANSMCRLGMGPSPMWKTPRAMLRPGAQRQRNLTGSRARYEDEAWWWKREPGWNLGAPSWAWLCAAFRSAAAAFTADRLAAVKLPVLLLAAGHDRLVSTKEIARAARQLPCAELEIFPDAAHEILREADPVRRAAFARIDAFLEARAR